MNLTKIKLDTLAGGAVVERFEEQMQRVIANIDDMNTSAKAPREIVIKIKILPDGDRRSASFIVETKAILAEMEGVSGRIFMSRKGQDFTCYENDPDQLIMEIAAADEKIKGGVK